MRRGSIIGPVLLIVIGALFLANNLHPELPTLKVVADWWPFVLIAWGAVRIAEITFWWRSGRPLPQNGIAGGEWAFIVFLCIAGSSIFYGQKYRTRIPRIHVTGLEMLGDSYDYPLAPKSVDAGASPRIIIDNARGNARVTGVAGTQVSAKGHTTVRAYTQAEADKANQECPLEVTRQGDVVIVRTNHERLTGNPRVSSDIEIVVPPGSTVEARGKYGDFDITDIGGSVTVDSDNAGVRLNGIGGAVRVDARRGDIIRAINVKGNVEIRGSGADVELENIEGQSVVNGQYHGELVFRNLAKPFRFESQTTDLRVPRVVGKLEVSRGNVTGSDLVGPVYLKTRSKDVSLHGFSEGLDLQIDKGDVELRPGKLPLGRMDVRIRGGDVDVALPEGAKFELNAATDRGAVENGFAGSLREDRAGKGARLSGSVGGGPMISLHTDRGRVSVRKSADPAPQAKVEIQRQ